jgi:hypothetical protein
MNKEKTIKVFVYPKFLLISQKNGLKISESASFCICNTGVSQVPVSLGTYLLLGDLRGEVRVCFLAERLSSNVSWVRNPEETESREVSELSLSGSSSSSRAGALGGACDQ